MKGMKMEGLHEYISEFRKQLEKGAVQKAYQGLMEYIMGLRTHLKNKYPEHFVSGSIYYGYMDMTYFSFTPKSLHERKLKIAIVFNYDAFRFEVWLSGHNKKVQQVTWKLFKESDWDKHHIVATTKGMDSIVENVLVDNPDFRDLNALTAQIEEGTLTFTADVEDFVTMA
jgi:hypothetical protein